MAQSKEQKQTAALHSIISDVLNKFDKLSEKGRLEDNLRGKKPNLESVLFLAEKIRRQQEGHISKTIGFFGAQKRGKSSLINCLLGCELMPVRVIPMSSVVIKTQQDDTVPEGAYFITINKTISPIVNQNASSLKEASEVLKQYGAHSGSLNEDVDEIIVKARFPNSKILKNGGVLVDTPGAELACSDESESNTEKRNESDLQRALNILDKTEIIIFCERADYTQSKNSVTFYNNEIQKRNPLNVINFKDKCKLENPNKIETNPEIIEQLKSEQMTHTFFKTFGGRLDRTLCVSSKEAKEGKNNKAFFEKSNIPYLEQRIISEIELLKPEFGIASCLGDLYNYLKQFKNPGLLPDKLKMHNFTALIKDDISLSIALELTEKLNGLKQIF